MKFFNIKNGRELTELNNKTYVVLLADIFEKFNKVSISESGINPLYHISSPGTTWSNGLRYTRADLELNKDDDLFQMFQNGIPGGLNGVFGDRYFEPDDNHKILYVDQNNLDGHSMSQHLPTGNFQLFEKFSITESSLGKMLNTRDCSNTSCVLIVDLIYPERIKEKSENFPLCPENRVTNPKNFTEYMKERVSKQYNPTKLICDQTNKEYYIVHYRNIKFYVRIGMIISQVHRIFSIDQSPWLEKDFEYNTN